VSAAAGIAVALAATIGDRTVTAQATVPAVHVVRDYAMKDRVWPSQ
jgi:hypothetical protein